MSGSDHASGYERNAYYSQADWDDVCDTPEATDAQLAHMRPLRDAIPELSKPRDASAIDRHAADPEAPLAIVVRRVREMRGMTQREFADAYGMALGRLRDWEQGRLKPDAMALSYLAVIEHEPEAVSRASKHRHAA